jgi:cation/acetate symporter
MSFTSRTRLVNPRLGAYFGIFTSMFAAVALLALIFEQLGAPRATLSTLMLAAPLLLYAAIGLGGFTNEPLEYFASGRRVPAVYSGLLLATTAMGATGMVALTGAFFIIGFDALCLVIGGLAGFVVMAILLAPFLRKFGAFTIPSYLGRRFDSRPVRLVAGILLSVPMLLFLAAELRVGAFAATLLTAQPVTITTSVLVGTLIVSLIAGGMRSLTWSAVAQSIAALLALVVPVAIVAVLLTNMPLPQLSHGPILRSIGRDEVSVGMPLLQAPGLAFAFPGDGLQPLAKRFSTAFGSVGSFAFVLATLTTMAGVAAAPWLLPRVAATPGVYETRKSLGWATVLFGIAMLTAASVAVFMREYVMEIVTLSGRPVAPDWVKQLVALDLAGVDTSAQRLVLTSFSFKRDAVLPALPLAAGMPSGMIQLALAGVIAAALAGAGASLVALGNVLTEDIVTGLSWDPAPDGLRLTIGRLALIAAAMLGGLIAVSAPSDPLKLVLWSLALTGSALFPILVMSIWWKRISAFGALAGLVSGFAVTVLAILAGEAGWIGLNSALAAAIGLPAGVLAAIAVTLATPAPGRHALELVRDIRVPGGEILYDREMRLQRLRNRRLT